jgi:hypothetical protein
LHSDSTQDSNFSKPFTFSVRPKSTASRGISNYLEPEITKQFDTSKGKTLRSGQVTFSEPITAKKWTTTAKNAIANLSKKQIPKSSKAVYPSKLHSGRQQTDILKEHFHYLKTQQQQLNSLRW